MIDNVPFNCELTNQTGSVQITANGAKQLDQIK